MRCGASQNTKDLPAPPRFRPAPILMSKTRKQLLTGLALSAFFLWLAFRRAPLGELWASLKNFNYAWFLLVMFFIMLSMAWRAERWRLLLGAERRLSTRRLFGPLMVGFGLNNILPARAGEILRPLALQKQDGVPFGEAIGTIVLERIFDSVTLLLMFFLALAFVPFGEITQTWKAGGVYTGAQLNLSLSVGCALAGLALAAWGLRRTGGAAAGEEAKCGAPGVGACPFLSPRRRRWLIAAAALLLAGAALAALEPFEAARNYGRERTVVISGAALDSITQKTALLILALLLGVVAMLFERVRALARAILRALPFLPARLRELGVRLIETFAAGLASLRSPGRVTLIALHSAGVWLTTAATFWAGGFGFAGMEITFLHAIALLAITAVGCSVPAAPGYWGLYEVTGVFGMLALGITGDVSQALAYILIVHFGHWLPTTFTGIFYAAKIHVSPAQAHDAEESEL